MKNKFKDHPFLFTFCAVFFGFLIYVIASLFMYINSGELDEYLKNDVVRLPAEYKIIKTSTNYCYLTPRVQYPPEPAYPTQFDIDAIDWNERYVFYHISNKQNLDGEWPCDKRFCILDTKTGENFAYKTEEEVQQALEKVGAESLKLKSILDFFPMTKGDAPHPFKIE